MNELLYSEIWYAIEVSMKGADDWFSTSASTSDTVKHAKGKLADLQQKDTGGVYEYRIVRKTVTTEVVE